MPDLQFSITGVEPANRGLVPLLQFQVEVKNTPADQAIRAVILQAQIQIQSPQRAYAPAEKEKLKDLFGAPEQWGQTLRNRLWALASTTVKEFSGRTQALLSVPCTYDLNVGATKYFYGLEAGEVPLLFLFSGTVFYAGPNGEFLVQQISWNAECVYRMPVTVWQQMMDHHYPNSAWVSLDREVFEQLCSYKRRHGWATWEETVRQLLAAETEGSLVTHG